MYCIIKLSTLCTAIYFGSYLVSERRSLACSRFIAAYHHLVEFRCTVQPLETDISKNFAAACSIFNAVEQVKTILKQAEMWTDKISPMNS